MRKNRENVALSELMGGSLLHPKHLKMVPEPRTRDPI